MKLKVKINVKYNESMNTYDIVRDCVNWSLFNDETEINYNTIFTDKMNNFNARELEQFFSDRNQMIICRSYENRDGKFQIY